MTILGARHSPPGHPSTPTDQAQLSPALAVTGRAPIPIAARSCCCPSAPFAQVITPATASRPTEVDLLLCAHHLRISAVALRAAGAAVFDRDGQPVELVTAVFAPDPSQRSAQEGRT